MRPVQLRVGLGALCAALLLAPAPAAAAAGRIAFVSDRDGDKEIYTMSSDGTQVRQLTHNALTDIDPAISPDGRSVAFVGGSGGGDNSGTRDVYVMNVDGSHVRRLTFDPRSQRYPAWSPDGRAIVFRSNVSDNFELYVMDAATGRDRTRLTASPGIDSEPRWSAGGDIAFMSERFGNREILTMRADGSGVARVTDDPGQDRFPTFAPDGDSLVFSSNRSAGYLLYSTALGGGPVQGLTHGSGQDSHPSFAPEGDALAFDRATPERQIYVATLAGARALTPPASGENIEPSWGPIPLAPSGGHVVQPPHGVGPARVHRLRVTLTLRRATRISRARITVRLQADAPCRVRLSGVLRVHGHKARRPALRARSLSLVAGPRRSARLRLTASTRHRLLKLAAAHGRASIEIIAVATPAVGARVVVHRRTVMR